MTTDTYSPTYSKPFAIYDQATQSLKMFEDTLLSDSTAFSGRLPVSGMMRNGMLFEHQKSERHTKERGFSSLPTPTVSDTFTGNLKSSQQKPGSMHSVTLPQAAKMLPTPTASDWKGANNSGSGSTSSIGLATKIDNLQTNWGKFEPAIRRWEKIIGRLAPAPTKPDGKYGNHRLSSRFTEWMMGLPEGWITDVGLTRNEELKACGNGVVPQQAKLALSRLVK